VPSRHKSMYLRLVLVAMAAVAVLTAASCISLAQESGPQPLASAADSPATAVSGPSAAMRDALIAACSQSDKEFTKFLTERNTETFASLTPAARVAFMKRFVLLDEPGKPSQLASPSGRPLIRCETPAGAAEMQVGGAAVEDNLAFLPVEIRDATDSVGANVMHVKMGLVREHGGWKLLSVGLVLLDLPSLAVEWDAAEMDSTERTALDNLKKIAQAIETYRHTYSRLPDSLEKLAPPTHGAASPDAAGLLDADDAAGAKNGYRFRYVLASANTLGAPAKFELAATPQTYGRTGRRSFFRDTGGVFHAADRKGAVGSEADPKIE
jgi:hypothetical protein